jgi:CRP/FNR family transcriptional regulator
MKPASTEPQVRFSSAAHGVACESCEVRHLAICTALSSKELEKVEAMAVTRQFAEGELVYAAEDLATIAGTVLRGTIKAYKLLADGRQQIIGFLQPGDFIGSTTQESYRCFAEAITPVELCVFPLSSLNRVIHELPNLEHQLLKMAAEDLDLAQEWMLLLGRKTAQERLATFLLLVSDKAMSRGLKGGVVDLPMNRAEIADYLGLTIETVSRQVGKLKGLGYIQPIGNHQIQILNPAQLRQIAEGS